MPQQFVLAHLRVVGNGACGRVADDKQQLDLVVVTVHALRRCARCEISGRFLNNDSAGVVDRRHVL